MRSLLALLAAASLATTLVWSAGRSRADEYTVREGDTLSEIAERHGMTAEELAQSNGIVDPDLILSGEVLLVPGAAAGAASGVSYVVRSGDTLSEIAERFGVPARAVARANGLSDPHLIIEGRVLTIPALENPSSEPVDPGLEPLLDQFALEEGLDPGIVKAIAYVESGWDQNAVSPSGAVGVMQLQPSTGYWLERDVFVFDLNLETSPYDNIRAGARYLRILMDLTGDIDQAVAAYYQGYGSLSLGVIYEETLQYVDSVQAVRDRYWP